MWYYLFNDLIKQSIEATGKDQRRSFLMNNWKNEATDKLCLYLSKLKTQEEAYAFLEDICTISEILDISQRLSVAELLCSGENYSSVGQKTRASSATISRVSKCLAYGTGGYKMMIERVNGKKSKESEKKDD